MKVLSSDGTLPLPLRNNVTALDGNVTHLSQSIVFYQCEVPAENPESELSHVSS